MAKITREVNINYIASGLENIIKAFEKLDPSQLTTKAQKATSEITNTAKTMLDQINLAMKKGDISQEMAKKYEKMFESFIGTDFDRKFKAILEGVGGDFDAAFSGMTAKAVKLNDELKNIESEITVEQKGFEVEGDKVNFATQSKKNEVAAKALQEVLLENSEIEKTSLTRAKDKLPTYTNLEQNQTRVNQALDKMTVAQRKNLKDFVETGKVTEANAANVDLLVKKMEGNLSVQEVQQRLQAKKLIDEKLEKELKDQKNKLIDLENKKIEKTNQLKDAMDPVKIAKEEVDAQKKVNQAQQTYNKNQAAVVEILSVVGGSVEDLKKEHEEKEKILRSSTKETEKNTNATKNNGTTLGKAANQVLNYGVAFGVLRRIYRETLRTITDLDEALTEMAIVTTMSRKEAFDLADTMSDLARETGFTVTEISKLSTVYFRQGRALSEVIELTRVAAQAARIAGISAEQSANFLTSAINAFGFSAEQALAVSDRFAAIAASSASSYEELAIGLSKFAAQANIAGVSIDFAMGLLAKGVETTREAPETIGTALKTVIARMRELTDLGKTFEDGMDISRVETALRQVGIALRDDQGQFRDLEKVLTEIGMAWSTYTRNQQASIAVSLAGTRQQSRLIAIMQDFDRTLELVDVSQESAGATIAQQAQFMKSLQAATTKLQTAWQDFIRTIGETETIIGIVRFLTFLIDGLTEGLQAVGLSGKNATVIILGIVVAMKSWNTITAVGATVQKLFTKTVVAQTVANAGATKGLWAMVAAKSALLLPIILIVGAIGILTVGIIKMSKSSERAAAKLEEMSQEAQAINFETLRASRNINKLTEQIEKLESLKYLTSEQEDELETLKEKLLELVDEEIAEKFRKNIITWQEVLDQILIQEGSNLAKRVFSSQNVIQQLAENLKMGQALPLSSFGEENLLDNYGVYDGFVAAFVEPSSSDIRILTNNLVNLYSGIIGDLSEESQEMLRHVIENREFTPNDLMLLGEDPRKFVKDNLAPIVKEFEEFTGSINFEQEKFSDVIKSFKKSYESIEEDFDLDLKAFIEREFGVFVELSKLFKEVDGEVTGFIANLEKLNLTSTKDVQDGFSLFGDEFVNLTEEILEFSSTLEGFSEEQAIRYAFARASQETENLEAKAWLLNTAFKETTLEIVQNLDTIQSRISRISDVQQQWIEGTLSAQDLFEFIQSNADLLETLDDVDDFLSGSNMATKVFNSLIATQNNLVDRLRYNWELYHSTTDEAQKSEALQQIAILGAATAYRGELRSLTQEQHNYNASLRVYNNLADIGINTTEILSLLTNNMGTAMATVAASTQRNLSDIQDAFANEADGIDELSGNLLKYFNVVGNQLIPNMVEIGALESEESLHILGAAFESYQEVLNDGLNSFLETREESLRIEKDSLNKQKKTYEDYFDTLDRLEKQRERSTSRQSIVEQLQRLEGATDERSRQRALELRRELSQVNEEQAKDTQTEAREALLQGFDDRYAELENTWALATQDYISNLATAGTDGGNAFVKAVRDKGLFPEETLENIGESIGVSATNSIIDTLLAKYGDEGFAGMGPFVPTTPDPESDIDLDLDTEPSSQRILEREAFKQAWFELLREKRGFWGRIGTKSEDMQKAEEEAKDVFGFAKGGMVDFTGPAMLHGSSSSPEAVLNPAQTEMFMGLRNALEKVSVDGTTNNSSINIEKIAISTNSMNNSQDFRDAGETLAKAFKNAIQRKGITVNTNKA